MSELRNLPKVIGTKQTAKALQKDEVSVLYIAKDAENRIIEPLESQARENGVQVVRVPNMKELGKAFGIEVGAAAAALLKKY
ncbi:MAG: ribosomal L7Ae/L30e/S12e/Gadd45 family protein [Peptococcaceae bacterium]